MNAKHTPGPWMYDPANELVLADEAREWPQPAIVRIPVAQTYYHEANARLIAAAPELLAALKALEQWAPDPCGFEKTLPGYQAVWDGMHVAIAKATEGRTDPREPDYSRPGLFATHNCSRCDNGRKPCAQGAPNRCDNPRARND